MNSLLLTFLKFPENIPEVSKPLLSVNDKGKTFISMYYKLPEYIYAEQKEGFVNLLEPENFTGVHYLKENILVFAYIPENYSIYNPKFGDDKLCECGHPYYRHFDTYDDMAAVGCKYCHTDEECSGFKEKVI